MNWTQISVLTTSEAVEAVANIFMDFDASGVKIEDAEDFKKINPQAEANHGRLFDMKDIPHISNGAIVSSYFPDSQDILAKVPMIEERVRNLSDFGLNPGPAEVKSSIVADEDWATEWEKYYHPVRLTRYLTIVPSWEGYNPTTGDEQVIRLDPGMAFGTGTHPTTQLSLQALETVIRGGESMIDVGTGSGVLSIAAKRLGVGDIFATDVDDIAVKSAKDNVRLNFNDDAMEIVPNDLLNGIHKQVDIIVANILAEILVPLAPQAFENLKPGGKFITAGIINSKLDVVKEAITNSEFKVLQILNMGDWYSIIAQKPTKDED
ncbi:50S ribosomal protein L11 methyltransferase [Lentilactobacillus sp. SPB1-3]|uniref:50S ribosomal protein L11 methyltransferase n=1 Tax=Lentilactobacillus terminaliae TaxID=3003483 RepID=A0ACD5DCR3_9LACO|nr:50S ribosomal protein L11 methyltransferase [Lentilactobacillus sp. SPB1-3]MCZ0977294.1 50S ribosomal protein L11 methyltransferase [Lentilactobacillus sp. SPB1-3]